MRRFFVEGIDARSKTALISGDEFFHLKKVLRLKHGDEVNVFNGRGIELKGRIQAITKEAAHIEITGQVEGHSESPVRVTLVQAILKGEKNELVVQKATELGARAVCFYSTQRTVRLVKERNEQKTINRWQRVSVEAAKQCKRAVVPEVVLTNDFKDAIGRFKDFALKVFLYEGDNAEGLSHALGLCNPDAVKDIAVVVGPEGGFSDDELKEAASLGYIVAGLGPRRLKSETAAIAALSVIQNRFGGLG
jgi:16S rRNA (uracil1498-N3)-methyltransferase